jgi:hypothetical protein
VQDKLGIQTGIDPWTLQDIADTVVRPQPVGAPAEQLVRGRDVRVEGRQVHDQGGRGKSAAVHRWAECYPEVVYRLVPWRRSLPSPIGSAEQDVVEQGRLAGVHLMLPWA